MSGERDIRSDLEAGASDELVRLAERLTRERPVPTPAFRGGLRRRLRQLGPGRPRPARLRCLITAYATAGTMLLLVGALSAAGAGPLAA